MNTQSKNPARMWRRSIVALTALSLVAAACGDDDDSSSDTDTTEAEAETETTDAPETETTEADTETTEAEAETETTEAPTETTEAEMAGEMVDLDANGDGEVRIGIAAAGPRDDGAYYQAVVDAAETFSAENGWGEVIVVDNIQAADAATELANLAQQPVDILIVGASEIAEPMPDLAEEYSDIFWYCNCGAGFPESEFYLQSQDNGAGIAYTAGVATGIALRDSGGDSVAFLGCCDLGFEIQHYLAYQLGLSAVDESLTFTYVPTGDFPFDFDNIQNASAAYENAVAEGADAIYPYLGGAHEPIVQLANEGGQIVLSAGASDVCTREGDLSWDIAVRFDGGDYVREIFPQILDGSAQEGDIIVYSPGEEPDVAGAVICDATPEQQAEMDEAYALVASGELDAAFGEIAAEAFGG
ncbi:MAG: BMP family ABC transporter substrate-binding protein [Ilumatobacter sp.]|nr:BMP family ABC transporter substrate-binding protein [Ilumatobacter sp.]